MESCSIKLFNIMKHILKLSFFLMLCTQAVTVNAQTSTAPTMGDGTSANPYQISTLDNLYWLSQNSSYWGSYFVQTADIEASGTSVWDSGSGFTPIGNSTTNFTGNYNGKGHAISNLYISRSSTDYVGFFGYISSAGIVDSLSVSNSSVTGGNYVGALAGKNSGTIRFSSAPEGSITGVQLVGGLVGWNEPGTVTLCYSSGTVTGTSSNICFGGLLGWSYGGPITNCYSLSSVTATSGSRVGGLVGFLLGGAVTKCYATGSVKGNSDFGGLVGMSSGTATNCFYNNEVFTESTDYGTGKTTAEMKTASTYTDAGWDFAGENTNGIDDYWGINNADNNGYPCFISQLKVPMVTTQSVSCNTTNTTVTANGTLACLGSSAVTAHGFCWSSTNSVPTIANDTVNLGATSDTGSFSAWLSGLSSYTTYYVRAYATNAEGTSYGESITVFTSVGSGTSSNPYRISTLADLKFLSENSSYWGSYFIQTADIDAGETKNWNSGSGFSPIGSYDSYDDVTGFAGTSFSGHYNGSGYTISGIYINRTDNGIGLFGLIEGASIDSLALCDANINGAVYCGGLVGICYNSKVSCCHTTGSVSGSYDVGGIAGLNSSSTISNCYNTGSVSGYYNVGGIAGWNSSSTISNCNNTGSVSGSSDNAGGIVGLNSSSTINNCYNTGGVSGASFVGGINGDHSNSSLSNCYNTGSVSGSDYVGAINGNDEFSDTFYCYYNSETSGQSDNNGTGLTTAEMKQQTSFSGWNFDSLWAIRADSTYPALRSVDNAPFAFADTISPEHTLIPEGVAVSEFLNNDYDYEAVQENLVYRINSISAGTISDGKIYFPNTYSYGDLIKVTYRVGEIRSSQQDTLWGNIATSLVIYTNHNPEWNNTTITVVEDTPIDILLATDADGDSLSYTILTAAVNGTTLIRNDSLYYTPDANYYGKDSLQIAFSDGISSDTVWIHITISAVNDAPVITSTAVTTATEDVTYSYTVTATDVDGDALTYSLTTYPTGMTISNGILSWTPVEGVTTASVTVAVSDGDTTVYQSFTITVTAVNDAPVVTSTPITTATEDVAYSYTVTATDIDSDVLTYSLTTYPTGMTISSGVISWTPTEGVTTAAVTVAVSDGDTAVYQTFTVLVTAVNDAPFVADTSVTTTIGTAIAVALPVTDVDGTVKSIVIDSYPANGNIKVSGTTLTYTPDDGFVGMDTIIWYALDNVYAVSNTATLIITVTENPTYTITASAGSGGSISPSGDVSVEEGSGQTFTISAITGYHIADVLVDGSSVGAVSSYTFSSVSAAHTISASFAINTHTITASAGLNGSITPSGDVSVNEGDDQSFTISASSGYHIADVLVDGSSVGAVSSYTFSSVSAAHTISASFAINTHTITASAGDNGSINPLGAVSVNEGDDQSFTIAASSGYHIADVLVDGSSVGAVSSYTFSSVSAAHTISASFAINTHTITASAESNGSITPSGDVSVNEGDDQSFTIAASSGYHIADVLVDGSSVGAVSNYTFSSVTASHTIAANFATTANSAPVITSTAPTTATEDVEFIYTVTATDPEEATLSYSISGQPDGMAITGNVIAWIPGEGVLTSGEVTLTVSDGELNATETFTVTVTPVNDAPVARDTTITTMTATAISLSLPVSDVDGSISKILIEEYPANGVVKISGTTLIYTSNSEFSGNDVISWVAKDNGGLYSNTATLAVTVTAKPAYTITATAGENGSISPSGSVTVTEDDSQTFTIIANTGYHIDDVLVDGISVGAVSNYTFSGITASHTIAASFAETTVPVYTITASAGDGGTISPSGSVSVEEGSSLTFTVTASTGYHVDDVLVDGTSVGAVSSYTFSNVTASHTIAASFAASTYTITFIITSSGSAVSGASVSINGQTLTTDASGVGTVSLTNGNYSYTVSASEYSDATGLVTVNGADVNEAVLLTYTDIDDAKTISLSAYPNPFNDKLTITGENGVSGRFTITSIIGMVVYNGVLNGERTELNLAHLNNGVYLLQITFSGKRQTFRLVKE
ncbi:MAG: Ig-like domain-containing protein [Bacteroidales bacterium]